MFTFWYDATGFGIEVSSGSRMTTVTGISNKAPLSGWNTN
jgi:hypothetical protein